MAYNYSYGEIQRMKEDAIRRVREMQSQAQTNDTEEVKEPIREAIKAAEAAPEIKVQHQNTHNAIPFRRRSIKAIKKQQPHVNSAIPLNLHGLPGKAMELLNDDDFSEQALLLIVIFLLVNEKCDTALILAMLYILS